MKKNPHKDQLNITQTESFAGTIEEVKGKKTLAITSRDWYDTQINKFKVGEKVTLYLSSRRPKRSDAQNRYLWGAYYPLIAEETGEQDIERLHEYFKGKFLTKEIVEVMGEKVRIKRSTTNLSKSDFIMFIMQIEELTGVKAPPAIDDINR